MYGELVSTLLIRSWSKKTFVRLINLLAGKWWVCSEKAYLADVCNVSANKRPILRDGGVNGGKDVNVGGTSSVVSGKVCLQERNTIAIGLGDSTSKSCILKAKIESLIRE